IVDREQLVPTGPVVDFTDYTRIHAMPHGVAYSSVCCEGLLRFDNGHVNLDLVCHSEGYRWCASIMENALRVMMAYIVMQEGGFMVHSACVVDGANASLLIGHSGAGKSTCSQLALNNGLCVISDDINVILPGGSGNWKVVPVPFNGSGETPPVRLPDMAEVPLAGIYELRQSREHRASLVSGASSVAKIYSCLPFINLDEMNADKVIDKLAVLVSEVPFMRLDFRRDPGFIKVLRKAS
ncbi:MAG: hypothetical protein KJO85_08575, partial [Gammaproteobacteria bacterium]|nr:hypothetical protein [Gammaproteobacteria bacterium]